MKIQKIRKVYHDTEMYHNNTVQCYIMRAEARSYVFEIWNAASGSRDENTAKQLICFCYITSWLKLS